MNHSFRYRLIGVAGLLLQTVPLQAAVNDIYPGDYYPLTPGASTVTLYAIDRRQEGPYAQGEKLLGGQLDASIMALRLAHAVPLGDTTVAGTLVLPWSQVTAEPATLSDAIGSRATGFGDLRMGLTAWLINDPLQAHYLGLTAMLIAPTGDYDAGQRLNPGENRWRLILGGGWQKDFTPQFLVELFPEVAIYGDNDDVRGQRLEQSSSYALTGYLRYRLTPAWHVHLGGQINGGGETRVAGVDQHNPANNRRVMAGFTWFLPNQQQLILRAAHETSIDNGFRTENEIAVRYQKRF